MTIPAELQAWPQWVCWRAEQRGGKPTKLPVDPRSGELASSTDPSTWSSFDDAVAAVARLACDGVGFVFSETDPFAGIDLDDCFDQEDELGDVARQIVEEFATYTEVSPSGQGLHCILRGAVPGGARKQAALDGQKVEVYSQGRFFCMTGASLGTKKSAIGDRQPELEALCRRLKAAAHARDHSGTKLHEGEGRNNELTRRLGLEVAKGVTGADLARRARELNNFDPPLDDVEVEKILSSAEKWPVGAGEPLVCEAAHAEVLKDAWLGSYRWSEQEHTWRVWTGRVWQKVAESVVAGAARQVLHGHYGRCLAEDQRDAEYKRLRSLHQAACKHASVVAALAFLKGEAGFHTELDQWDADPYLLNCADGLLDVRAQTLRPHDPAALCTKLTRWGYADSVTTGAWERHLARCLPEAAVRRQVQRDLGRALVDATLEESLPIWHGSGANGKSTTERALLHGLAGYAQKAVSSLLVVSKSEHHPTEIADLAGSRLVFCEEIEDGKHLAEALVKDLTGGARKKARFMRCDNFTFEQTFSIFLLVNHRPTITGADLGIWRRIRLVPWTVSIPLAEQRPQDDVVTDLVADGSWMLRWMVAGFADWQADHHWVAAEVQAATAAYRAEQDRLGGFLAECCEKKSIAQAPVGGLYDAYVLWCATTDEEALGKIAFGKALRNAGLTQTKLSDGSRVWSGIRLRTATDGRNSGFPREDHFSRDEPEKLPVPAVAPEDGGLLMGKTSPRCAGEPAVVCAQARLARTTTPEASLLSRTGARLCDERTPS